MKPLILRKTFFFLFKKNCEGQKSYTYFDRVCTRSKATVSSVSSPDDNVRKWNVKLRAV